MRVAARAVIVPIVRVIMSVAVSVAFFVIGVVGAVCRQRVGPVAFAGIKEQQTGSC
jgi:hypothetical protein